MKPIHLYISVAVMALAIFSTRLKPAKVEEVKKPSPPTRLWMDVDSLECTQDALDELKRMIGGTDSFLRVGYAKIKEPSTNGPEIYITIKKTRP